MEQWLDEVISRNEEEKGIKTLHKSIKLLRTSLWGKKNDGLTITFTKESDGIIPGTLEVVMVRSGDIWLVVRGKGGWRLPKGTSTIRGANNGTMIEIYHYLLKYGEVEIEVPSQYNFLKK